jgi:fucose 4-O-acetylase-like acetyltransferase
MPCVFSTLQLRNSFLEHPGRESLYYYLWHPLFFMAFKHFLYPLVNWPTAFILTFGITLAVLYGVLAALQRSNSFPGITTALGITRLVRPTYNKASVGYR